MNDRSRNWLDQTRRALAHFRRDPGSRRRYMAAAGAVTGATLLMLTVRDTLGIPTSP